MHRSEFDKYVDEIAEVLDPHVGDKRFLAFVEGTGWPAALDQDFRQTASVDYDGEGDFSRTLRRGLNFVGVEPDDSRIYLPGVKNSFGNLPGHSKRVAFGKLEDRDVVRLGRVHPYEGGRFAVRAIIEALKDRLDGLIITNGVGSLQGNVQYDDGNVDDGERIDALGDAHRLRVREKHKVGDLVVVDSSHFGYLHSTDKPLFPGEFKDVHNSRYRKEDGKYLEIARGSVEAVQGHCAKAVYAFWQGSDFEAPIVKMEMRGKGCDVIGMSATEIMFGDVPAAHLALVTNPMFGLHDHEDNLASGRRAGDNIRLVAANLARNWPSRAA